MLLRFGDEVVDVTPADAEAFTAAHDEQFFAASFVDGSLMFRDPRWRANYLGRGEEKAVFCVCDHNRRVFAIELIDERSYARGRFVTGAYFLERRIPGLAGIPFNPAASEFGLRLTGLVKIREFAYGYEWSRFRWRPDRRGLLDHVITTVLRLLLSGKFRDYQLRYRDVHERNVLFEVRPWRSRGVPMLMRDAAGKLRLVRVRLAPIDLR